VQFGRRTEASALRAPPPTRQKPWWPEKILVRSVQRASNLTGRSKSEPGSPEKSALREADCRTVGRAEPLSINFTGNPLTRGKTRIGSNPHSGVPARPGVSLPKRVHGTCGTTTRSPKVQSGRGGLSCLRQVKLYICVAYRKLLNLAVRAGVFD